MPTASFLMIVLLVLVFISCTNYHAYAVVGKCNYNLVLLWSRETGHTPFAATPVIADLDLDGHPEVIAAPFAHQVTVVQGHNGHVLPDSQWPQQLVDTTVHASALVYDADSDGKPDVIMPTSDAYLLFYHNNGELMLNKTFKIPGVQVAKNWYKEQLNVEKTDIHSYILDKPAENNQAEDGYIVVDAHILSSAVIADMNADNVIEEMVIPVSYYFDEDYYSDAEKRRAKNITVQEISQYLVGSIVFFNLTSGEIMKTVHLELTKVDAEYPGYVMFTPTVVDLDGSHGPLETIVGTYAGQLHVLSSDGTNRPGWPISRDAVHGQVMVADVDLDGLIEIVAMDTSANVMCYHGDGYLVWETAVSGTLTTGPRVADIEQDGHLDIIIGTNDGQVWILEGADGKVKKQWPFRVGRGLSATPLITQLTPTSVIDVVILGEDSHLHIVSGDGKKCRHAVSLGETSLVGLLAYDLVPTVPGLELLVATRDGTLMCLGRRAPEPCTRATVVLDSQPAEMRSANDFMYSASKRETEEGGVVSTDLSDVYLTPWRGWRERSEVSPVTILISSHLGKVVGEGGGVRCDFSDEFTLERVAGEIGIVLEDSNNGVLDVTGTSLDLHFHIIDKFVLRGSASNSYKVNVYLGNKRLVTSTYNKPGSYYLTIPCPGTPTQALVTVVMTTKHGIIYQDSLSLQFNTVFLHDLQWLLVCPFVAMATVLLLLHGYPTVDLLPVTLRDKMS